MLLTQTEPPFTHFDTAPGEEEQERLHLLQSMIGLAEHELVTQEAYICSMRVKQEEKEQELEMKDSKMGDLRRENEYIKDQLRRVATVVHRHHDFRTDNSSSGEYDHVGQLLRSFQ